MGLWLMLGNRYQHFSVGSWDSEKQSFNSVSFTILRTGIWWFVVFEQYQKARCQFVQTVAELSSRPQNIEILQNAGVMSLLRPLLLDTVPSIQQTAALALGRLANYNNNLAEAVVKGDILPQLVYSLSEQNVPIFALILNLHHGP